MAYYNSGLMPGESYFGDFPGGYSQSPAGIFIPQNTINTLGLNAFLQGANLPGRVHFGSPNEIIGPIPIGAGYGNSNLDPIEQPIF